MPDAPPTERLFLAANTIKAPRDHVLPLLKGGIAARSGRALTNRPEAILRGISAM